MDSCFRRRMTGGSKSLLISFSKQKFITESSPSSWFIFLRYACPPNRSSGRRALCYFRCNGVGFSTFNSRMSTLWSIKPNRYIEPLSAPQTCSPWYVTMKLLHRVSPLSAKMSKLARSDEPKVNKCQIKSKTQMSKTFWNLPAYRRQVFRISTLSLPWRKVVRNFI